MCSDRESIENVPAAYSLLELSKRSIQNITLHSFSRNRHLRFAASKLESAYCRFCAMVCLRFQLTKILVKIFI